LAAAIAILAAVNCYEREDVAGLVSQPAESANDTLSGKGIRAVKPGLSCGENGVDFFNRLECQFLDGFRDTLRAQCLIHALDFDFAAMNHVVFSGVNADQNVVLIVGGGLGLQIDAESDAQSIDKVATFVVREVFVCGFDFGREVLTLRGSHTFDNGVRHIFESLFELDA